MGAVMQDGENTGAGQVKKQKPLWTRVKGKQTGADVLQQQMWWERIRGGLPTIDIYCRGSSSCWPGILLYSHPQELIKFYSMNP